MSEARDEPGSSPTRRPPSLGARLAALAAPSPSGDDGQPSATPEERRFARSVVIAATAWMLAVVLWEAFGPVLAGHYASSASMGIIADNMLRWRIGAPVWLYTDTAPTPADYYCHHPWGIFWSTTALRALVGRHDVVCRLAAMLLSVATPALLAALGRALWGPIAGAATALAFVCLPIALSFAQFNALEVPLIAWGTLFLWGWLRHRQRGQTRHLAIACLGAFLALNSDWPAFVLVAAALLLELPSLVASRGRGAARFVCLATLALAVGGGYLWLFHAYGRLDDLLAAGEHRSAGAKAPLAEVLASRKLWIELSFTPLVIAVGKVMACVLVLRAVVLRRLDELLPLTVLAAASFQYLVFRQGADVHVFWPHHFAAYAALAVGGLAATLRGPLELISARRVSSAAWRARLGFALVALLLVPVLRDACLALGWARRTGGRFDERGGFVLDDGDRTAALRQFAAELPAQVRIGLHPSTSPTWAQVWALGGRTVSVGAAALSPELDATIVDLRFTPPAELAELARRAPLEVVGPLALAVHGAPPRRLEVRSFAEREPSIFEWMFVSAHEPSRNVVSDPFSRWEVASELGLAAEPPARDPVSLEELRVAHAVALASGDPARADRHLAALCAGLTRLERRYADGTELLGYELVPGSAARARVYLRAAGPLGRGVQPRVRSFVVERAPLSITPPDPKPREVAPPPFPHASRWRRGRVYALSFDLLERPGTERFELRLSDARGLERVLTVEGDESVELFRH